MIKEVNSLRALDLMGIPFSRMPVRSSPDAPARWVTFGMPHLGRYKWINDIVVFLYGNRTDAESATNSGGTGFFVSIPTKRWPAHFAHWHCVSNYHVAVFNKDPDSPPCSVIAVNTFDGKPHVIDLDPSEWIFLPNGPDVAVSPPQIFDQSKHKIGAIDISSLVTAKDEAEHDINVADDIFMVGRFVDYTGVETTPPAFRFGHISINDAQLEQSSGYIGRSIVLDMHSRSGFSGSPVFIYRTLGAHFLDAGIVQSKGHFVKLLGIHWGQFPEEWEIKDREGLATATKHKALTRAGPYIEGLSGMTCAIPSEDILRILNLPELQQMRDDEEKRIAGIVGDRPIGPKSEKAFSRAPLASDENPNHREDFMRLVDVAARKPPQEG